MQPWWDRLLGTLRVQWQKYKTTLIWLVVWLVAGVVLGIVTIFATDVTVGDINYHLIDGNILNATAIGSSMGSFIWQRVLSIAVPVLVVLMFALLSRVTAYAVFPVIMVHGYWLAIAVWWTFFYYSFTALLLIIFYLLWLLVVTAVILAGMLWALQCGANFREQQCTKCKAWLDVLRGAGVLIVVAVGLGFLEYLVFWTVLGKIVYKPR